MRIAVLGGGNGSFAGRAISRLRGTMCGCGGAMPLQSRRIARQAAQSP